MGKRGSERAVALAVDQRIAAVRRIEPENHSHGGRFAGPVRPNEAGYLAGLDRERKVVDGHRRPVALGEIAHLDRGFHGWNAMCVRPPCASRRGGVLLGGDAPLVGEKASLWRWTTPAGSPVTMAGVRGIGLASAVAALGVG